jgi:hypothetical protein
MKDMFGKLRTAFASSKEDDRVAEDGTTVQQTTEAGKVDHDAELQKPDDVEGALVDETAQHGVQTVEATTLVWTRATLATVFVLSVFS